MGAIVALAYRDEKLRATLLRYVTPLGMAGFGMFICMAAVLMYYPDSLVMPRVGYFAISLSCTALVSHGVFGGNSILNSGFRSPLLRQFGKYSYFIYVTHLAVYYFTLQPIRHVVGGGGLAALVSGALCIGLMLCLGATSWYLFESRSLEARKACCRFCASWGEASERNRMVSGLVSDSRQVAHIEGDT
jgi:peptidoglycan/LPS O-acetylase OafA/YrhL